jgi:nitroimidazol reductase NimA-like FMN-containing flavoprotein (pyridoxamine 5'-phosphate oxidase superfamily)
MTMAAEKKKSKAAIRKEIIEFLNATSACVDPKPKKQSCGLIHKNALVLATYSKNKPRATVLEFFNEELTLYIFGEPGGKIANIKRNPNVSAVVYEQPLDHSRFQKSLQIFGEAELINIRNNPKLFRSKVKKWHLNEVGKKIMSPMIKEKNLSEQETEKMLKKGIESLNLIKITPVHIILKKWNPGFIAEKYEWKKG